MKNHDIVEKNLGLLTIFIIIAISFGGLVQIVPQFFLKETMPSFWIRSAISKRTALDPISMAAYLNVICVLGNYKYPFEHCALFSGGFQNTCCCFSGR